jgi:hypothetical protein
MIFLYSCDSEVSPFSNCFSIEKCELKCPSDSRKVTEELTVACKHFTKMNGYKATFSKNGGRLLWEYYVEGIREGKNYIYDNDELKKLIIYKIGKPINIKEYKDGKLIEEKTKEIITKERNYHLANALKPWFKCHSLKNCSLICEDGYARVKNSRNEIFCQNDTEIHGPMASFEKREDPVWKVFEHGEVVRKMTYSISNYMKFKDLSDPNIKPIYDIEYKYIELDKSTHVDSRFQGENRIKGFYKKTYNILAELTSEGLILNNIGKHGKWTHYDYNKSKAISKDYIFWDFRKLTHGKNMDNFLHRRGGLTYYEYSPVDQTKILRKLFKVSPKPKSISVNSKNGIYLKCENIKESLTDLLCGLTTFKYGLPHGIFIASQLPKDKLMSLLLNDPDSKDLINLLNAGNVWTKGLFNNGSIHGEFLYIRPKKGDIPYFEAREEYKNGVPNGQWTIILGEKKLIDNYEFLIDNPKTFDLIFDYRDESKEVISKFKKKRQGGGEVSINDLFYFRGLVVEASILSLSPYGDSLSPDPYDLFSHFEASLTFNINKKGERHGRYVLKEKKKILAKGNYNTSFKSGLWRGTWKGKYKDGLKHGKWREGSDWYEFFNGVRLWDKSKYFDSEKFTIEMPSSLTTRVEIF